LILFDIDIVVYRISTFYRVRLEASRSARLPESKNNATLSAIVDKSHPTISDAQLGMTTMILTMTLVRTMIKIQTLPAVREISVIFFLSSVQTSHSNRLQSYLGRARLQLLRQRFDRIEALLREHDTPAFEASIVGDALTKLLTTLAPRLQGRNVTRLRDRGFKRPAAAAEETDETEFIAKKRKGQRRGATFDFGDLDEIEEMVEGVDDYGVVFVQGEFS
jgi:hypothetical protein